MLQKQAQLKDSISSFLFQDHLSSIEKMSLTESKKQLDDSYQKIKGGANTEKLQKIEAIYSSYQKALTNIDRNQKDGLATKSFSDQISGWGQSLLREEFDTLQTSINTANLDLDTKYQSYLASLVTPVSNSSASTPGYYSETVTIDRGTFRVNFVKMSLSQIKVKTVSANETDCKDQCPAKSLADYVKESGAYAGINGTYFCPPDYASCNGKVNSYDFAFYNSNINKWLNSQALTWNNVGLASFIDNTPKFYRDSKDYNGSLVTAGISNFPMLLIDGQIAYTDNQLTVYQRDGRGPKGALGVDDQNIYLAIVQGATVPEQALVLKKMGLKNALNIDGGGSSALYINGIYRVGPGRSLPNAILLIK